MNYGYEKVRILLKEGAIPDFRQLASDIGRTNLANDMGMNARTLRRRVNDPGLWSIEELAKLSDLLGIEHMMLLEMADKLRTQKKNSKR